MSIIQKLFLPWLFGNIILIEQLYYDIFWHSKVNKYIYKISHSSIWSQTHNEKHQYNGKNNDKHHSKNYKFQSWNYSTI